MRQVRNKLMDQADFYAMVGREEWKQESIQSGRPVSIVQIVMSDIRLSLMFPPKGDEWKHRTY